VADVKLAAELARQVFPILAGRPSAIQGAVLCECLATWIAGFGCDLPTDERDKLRDGLLLMHLKYVRQMLKTYDDGAWPEQERSGPWEDRF
jgi:hypothetical protein